MLGFIHQTLFPGRRVSLMAVDERMKPGMKQKLTKIGIDLAEVPQSEGLQPCVSGHPDMQLLHLHDDILISHPHLSPVFYERLQRIGFTVISGYTALKTKYPCDIAYNIAILGKVAFHNIQHTDKVCAEYLKQCSIRLIHVKQGYAKCSVLPVTPESLITSDPSIARAAADNGFDVLYLPPQTNIGLTGLNYGFIGGTAGFIDKNLIAFAGNPDFLNDAQAVKSFLVKYGVKWIALDDTGIDDVGGLLPLYE